MESDALGPRPPPSGSPTNRSHKNCPPKRLCRSPLFLALTKKNTQPSSFSLSPVLESSERESRGVSLSLSLSLSFSSCLHTMSPPDPAPGPFSRGGGPAAGDAYGEEVVEVRVFPDFFSAAKPKCCNETSPRSRPHSGKKFPCYVARGRSPLALLPPASRLARKMRLRRRLRLLFEKKEAIHVRHLAKSLARRGTLLISPPISHRPVIPPRRD